MAHGLATIWQRVVARGVQRLQSPGGVVGVSAAGYHRGSCVQLVLETMESGWTLVELRNDASGGHYNQNISPLEQMVGRVSVTWHIAHRSGTATDGSSHVGQEHHLGSGRSHGQLDTEGRRRNRSWGAVAAVVGATGAGGCVGR